MHKRPIDHLANARHFLADAVDQLNNGSLTEAESLIELALSELEIIEQQEALRR